MIIVISGPPCSGKSALGDLLAARNNIAHLEMDAIRVRLMPDSPHTRHDRRVAYRAMHMAAELLLQSGRSVIVNACYGHAEDRREVEEIAARLPEPLFVIECRILPEVACERHRQRQAAHPGLDLTDERVAEMVRSFPHFAEAIMVDGAGPLDRSVELVEVCLEAGAGVVTGGWARAAETQSVEEEAE